MQCYITPLLHLQLTQSYCSFVLFPPIPLIVFLVAMKKCTMPLSEPRVDHRPRIEMVKKFTYLWGRAGIVTIETKSSHFKFPFVFQERRKKAVKISLQKLGFILRRGRVEDYVHYFSKCGGLGYFENQHLKSRILKWLEIQSFILITHVNLKILIQKLKNNQMISCL